MRIRRGFSCFCRNFQDFLKIIAKLLVSSENSRTFVLSGGQSGSPLTSKQLIQLKTARL
jgi:hypothetical protein